MSCISVHSNLQVLKSLVKLHIIDSTQVLEKNGCVVLHSSHWVPQNWGNRRARRRRDKRDLTTNSSNNVFYWHEKQTKSLQNLTTNFILDIRKYIYRIECAYMSKMPLISSRKVFFIQVIGLVLECKISWIFIWVL